MDDPGSTAQKWRVVRGTGSAYYRTQQHTYYIKMVRRTGQHFCVQNAHFWPGWPEMGSLRPGLLRVFPDIPEKRAPGPARPGSVNVCVLEQSFFPLQIGGKKAIIHSFGRSGQNWSELSRPGWKSAEKCCFSAPKGPKSARILLSLGKGKWLFGAKSAKKRSKPGQNGLFCCFRGPGPSPRPSIWRLLAGGGILAEKRPKWVKTGPEMGQKACFLGFWAAGRPKTQSNRPRKLQVQQKWRKPPFLPFRGGFIWRFPRGGALFRKPKKCLFGRIWPDRAAFWNTNVPERTPADDACSPDPAGSGSVGGNAFLAGFGRKRPKRRLLRKKRKSPGAIRLCSGISAENGRNVHSGGD